MTVEHESLRIAAPEDLPDQQSQRDGADLTFSGSYKPISIDQPSSNDSKDLQDAIAGGLAGDPGLATIIKSTKAFREATRKCLPREAKNGLLVKVARGGSMTRAARS
jgi:hypothetical protein